MIIINIYFKLLHYNLDSVTLCCDSNISIMISVT